MRIVFVSQGSLRTFQKREGQENADITLFGFNGVGEVSYEKELKGETSFFEDAARLSKRDKNLVVFGCVTDTRGHKRKSVAVAENGRLLGVSDMLYTVDGECAPGVNLKAYETKIGKIGVVVARDLYFPETVKALALCGCSYILCPFDKPISPLERAYLCVYAHVYGLPIFLCGEGFGMVASPKGELVFSSPHSPTLAVYEEEKAYHLVEKRTARHLF